MSEEITTQDLGKHWHRIAAMLLFKHGCTINLEPDDIKAFKKKFPRGAICVPQQVGGTLSLTLVAVKPSDEEAA